jgi:hypothetical protein
LKIVKRVGHVFERVVKEDCIKEVVLEIDGLECAHARVDSPPPRQLTRMRGGVDADDVPTASKE